MTAVCLNSGAGLMLMPTRRGEISAASDNTAATMGLAIIVARGPSMSDTTRNVKKKILVTPCKGLPIIDSIIWSTWFGGDSCMMFVYRTMKACARSNCVVGLFVV